MRTLLIALGIAFLGLGNVYAQTAAPENSHAFTGTNIFQGKLLCKNLENNRCADQFPGNTPEAKTNAAVSDLASTPGLVIIPGNMPSNAGCPSSCTNWNTLPNNATIWDYRFSNDQGLLEHSLPYAHSHIYMGFHAGRDDLYESELESGQFGLSINGYADAGGILGENAKANLVGLFVGTRRSPNSDRPIWGANFNTSYTTHRRGPSNFATALEIDLPNYGTADDTAQVGIGLRVISGAGSSGKKSGNAIAIGNSTGPGGVDSWERGITVGNFTENGIEIQATNPRVADLYLIPPANDTSPSVLIRNASNSDNVFSIDDSGNTVTPLVALKQAGARAEAHVTSTSAGDLQFAPAPGRKILQNGPTVIAGDLQVTGTVTKASGSFRIDHPLDPAHKYLSHSFVESPDMMDIYNGNIRTDKNGLAVVALPDYFEALNCDFRYQLTVLEQFAQAMIEKKVANNRFSIRTDKPFVEVSWQITGIRHDAYANAHRIKVEEDKSAAESGHYLHPELFAHP